MPYSGSLGVTGDGTERGWGSRPRPHTSESSSTYVVLYLLDFPKRFPLNKGSHSSKKFEDAPLGLVCHLPQSGTENCSIIVCFLLFVCLPALGA